MTELEHVECVLVSVKAGLARTIQISEATGLSYSTVTESLKTLRRARKIRHNQVKGWTPISNCTITATEIESSKCHNQESGTRALRLNQVTRI